VSSRGELAILLTKPGELDARATGTLARVFLSGGEPKHLLEDVAFADWSPDGRELAVQRRVDGAFQLEYPIGNTIIRPISQGQPFRLSPGGDKLAIMPGDDALAVYDRSGKKLATFPMIPPNESYAWDGNDALWVIAGESQTARSIWRVTLDGKAHEVYRSVGMLGLLHDASPDGRLLLHHGFHRLGVKSKPPGQERERELGVFNWSGVKAMSDDGRQLLLYETAEGGPGLSFLRSADGGPPLRLGEADPLALSPSGRWALLGPLPNRLPLSLVPTGAGEIRRLETDSFERAIFAWFMDEERVVVVASAKDEMPRSFLFEAGGRAPRPITPPGTLAIRGSQAMDSVLGWSFIDGAITRFPLDGGEPRPLGRVLPPHFPSRAAADGRSLFVDCGGVPRKIERLDLATGVRTPWKTLLPEDSAGVTLMEFVVLTPDGRGYAYGYGRFLQDLFVVGGLRGSP
jgi:eukaryotic-like serine/threonine-protein kinase